MKSELLSKMTAGVVTFSLAASCLGSVAIADSGKDSTEQVVVVESDNAMAGLEIVLNDISKGEQSGYTRLVSNMAKYEEDTKEKEKAVTTNDDNESKAKASKQEKETKQKKETRQVEETKYANRCVADTDSYVNVRKKASTDAEVIGKMYDGSVAEIISKDGDWYKIKSGSVTGYASAKYLKSGLSDDEIVKKYGTTVAKVTADILNVRSGANASSKVLTTIEEGDSYAVVDEYDEWVKVKKNDIVGFISKEYVNISVKFESAISIEEEAEKETKKSDVNKSESTKKESSDTSEKTTGAVMSVTDKEIKYMACLIYAEAGSEPYTGKIGVANVIINRVRSGNFPSSVIGVITQSGQFSPYRTGKLSKEMGYYEDGKYTRDSLRSDCVKAVKAALNGENVVGSRCFFNGASTEANKGHSNSMIIGGHMFW